MILSDRDIRIALGRTERRLGFTMRDNSQIQPASIDMRLGSTFQVYDTARATFIDPRDAESVNNCMRTVEVQKDEPFILHPGAFALGVTQEHVEVPDDLVAEVTGRSSLGRLGIIVHATAGLVDPGFHGNITLELSNLSPLAVKLWPGMRIAQLVILDLSSPAQNPYQGKYQGDTTAVASRIAEDKDY